MLWSQGSSSIQIVPALQPHAKQVDNYVRGSTWIASPFASNQLLKRSPDGSNHTFSEEEKKFWAENPEEYHAFRKSMEKEVSRFSAPSFLGVLPNEISPSLAQLGPRCHDEG